MPIRYRDALISIAACGLLTSALAAQDPGARPAPEDTEVWRPIPRVVTPGPAGAPAPPPADAIVLFDGTGLDQWVNARDGSAAAWPVSDSVVTVDKSVGDIRTRRSFRDYQLHLEWRVPSDVTGEGQARGNSGVFLSTSGTGYEVQILDSFENATYVNGMAGSVYKQSPPMVNASRRPGEWQVYDIVWTAPRFDEGGALLSPARVTVLYNGILVQNDFELEGETRYRGPPEYTPYTTAPLLLQAHGDPSPPISFRNIWLREIS